MEMIIIILNKLINLFSIFIYFLIGDSYLAYKNPEKLFKALDNRASNEESNIGIAYLGPSLTFTPQIVYIKNPQRSLFTTISDYGQSKNHYDKSARAPLKIVEQLIGKETVTTMQGSKAVHAKKIFKHYLTDLNELHQLSLETVNHYVTAERDISFPILINQIINIILGKAVFGINQIVSAQQTKDVREIGNLMTRFNLSTADIKKGHKRLQKVSTELLSASVENPINKDKYVARFAEITDLNNQLYQDIILSKLAAENIAGSFLASTNLADMIMKTINAIETKHTIKTKLLHELKETHSDLHALRQLPYLNLIYLEAQRLFSPSVIARKTSKKFTFFTEKKEYSIPAHSFLIAPIRARHLNPAIWPSPREFLPERFLIDQEKKVKQLMTFSDGQRACPAKYGLSEVIFKTFLSTFFKKVKQFELNSPIEKISKHALNTSWSQDYTTTFNMR